MPMMSGPTVYDRMKRTGYITGPRHRMGPAMDDMSPAPGAPPQGEGPSTGPPNLRDTAVEGSCGDCQHFLSGATGQCAKFNNAAVTPNLVCDEFTEKGPEEHGEESPGQEIPVETP